MVCIPSHYTCDAGDSILFVHHPLTHNRERETPERVRTWLFAKNVIKMIGQSMPKPLRAKSVFNTSEQRLMKPGTAEVGTKLHSPAVVK